MRSMESIDSLPFAQQQRLRFIESMVLWEGTVQRQRVCDVFRVNANHVTRDIQIYKKQFPKSLEYNPSVRAYEPGAKFSPQLASGDPGEYLALLHAYAESHSIAMLPVLGGDVHVVEALPSPRHAIDQQVLRCVVQATRHGKGVRVVYSSMKSDKPMPRTLWPHALVHAGMHWHIRAYDDLRNEFRNFAIHRIDDVSMVDTSSPTPVANDLEWHHKVLVEVIPNPKLNAHQQRVVAKEYGMKEHGGLWLWSESIRQCLVGYFAVHYRLDLQELAEPRQKPLVFRNAAAVAPYLFSGTGSTV